MLHQQLTDAAIALTLAFNQAGIVSGIFGGYAINAFGGERLAKDIDCLADLTKAKAVSVLDGKIGFNLVPQTREDYVAFVWKEKPESKAHVLVEVFPSKYPGMLAP